MTLAPDSPRAPSRRSGRVRALGTPPTCSPCVADGAVRLIAAGEQIAMGCQTLRTTWQGAPAVRVTPERSGHAPHADPRPATAPPQRDQGAARRSLAPDEQASSRTSRAARAARPRHPAPTRRRGAGQSGAHGHQRRHHDGPGGTGRQATGRNRAAAAPHRRSSVDATPPLAPCHQARHPMQTWHPQWPSCTIRKRPAHTCGQEIPEHRDQSQSSRR